MNSSAVQPAELVVVVGASGAFGEVMVDRLLANGVAVLAVGRSAASLAGLAQHRTNVHICAADLGNDTCIDTIRASVAALGLPVRMVVHSPGVPVAGGILQASTEALTQAVNIKVGGMLRLVRAVDSFLRPQSRLVGIGGHYGFEPTAYAATAGVANAALANLMRQLSWAYGPRGITAHLLAPGPADTERLRNVASHRAASSGSTMEDVLNDMKAESAINALTTPQQVAWAVCLLLAPEADAMAGSSLMLDSGRRRGLP